MLPDNMRHVLVSAAPGASVCFVSSLIDCLFTGRNIKISDLGNSHHHQLSIWIDTDIAKHGKSFDPGFVTEVIEGFRVNPSRPYHAPTVPAIGRLHLTDFSRILEIHPTTRIVYVTLEESDKLDISANLFFKYYLECSDPDNDKALLMWQELLQGLRLPYIHTKTNPWEVKRSELIKLLFEMSSSTHFNHWMASTPDDGRILTIRFRDIRDGKQEVVDELAHFLGVEPTKLCYVAMKRYARAQPDVGKLIDWLDI